MQNTVLWAVTNIFCKLLLFNLQARCGKKWTVNCKKLTDHTKRMNSKKKIKKAQNNQLIKHLNFAWELVWKTSADFTQLPVVVTTHWNLDVFSGLQGTTNQCIG